jgi:hypothetical protein
MLLARLAAVESFLDRQNRQILLSSAMLLDHQLRGAKACSPATRLAMMSPHSRGAFPPTTAAGMPFPNRDLRDLLEFSFC